MQNNVAHPCPAILISEKETPFVNRPFISMVGVLVLGLLILAGCGEAAPTATPPLPIATPPVPTATLPPPPLTPAPPPGGTVSTPGHITVQHILIGFVQANGELTVPGKSITRTQEQAKALAYDLLTQARAGANFDQLVATNTDDAPPGIYGMSDAGVAPGPGEYPRQGMVPAFGNVGFALQPGEVNVADYDPATSPYGYHVIKRLR